jgi:hypothetical protein
MPTDFVELFFCRKSTWNGTDNVTKPAGGFSPVVTGKGVPDACAGLYKILFRTGDDRQGISEKLGPIDTENTGCISHPPVSE